MSKGDHLSGAGLAESSFPFHQGRDSTSPPAFPFKSQGGRQGDRSIDLHLLLPLYFWLTRLLHLCLCVITQYPCLHFRDEKIEAPKGGEPYPTSRKGGAACVTGQDSKVQRREAKWVAELVSADRWISAPWPGSLSRACRLQGSTMAFGCGARLDSLFRSP